MAKGKNVLSRVLSLVMAASVALSSGPSHLRSFAQEETGTQELLSDEAAGGSALVSGGTADGGSEEEIVGEDSFGGLIEEEETALPDQTQAPDGVQTQPGESEIPTADTEAVLQENLGDGLIEEETQQEAAAQDQIGLAEDQAEGEDPTVAPASASSSIRSRALRMAAATSSSVYSGSYGEELKTSHPAAYAIYCQLADHYITQGQITSTINEKTTYDCLIKYTVNTSPYTFVPVFTTDSAGKKKVDLTTDEYLAVKSAFQYDVQSAVDALNYDYPEMFWAISSGYQWAVGAARSSADASQYTAYLTNIRIRFSEAYPGSSGDVSSYKTALAAAAEQIRAKADYDLDGTVSTVELVQSIHDYLCDRFYYASDALKTYETTGDYRIFGSGGAVLDSVGNGVVCEGYARSMKAFCDQLGIPCCLIVGSVPGSTMGHMWNGLQINGTWYMMDVTWDDQSVGWKYTYFLTAALAGGRSMDGRFSDRTVSAFTFSYPDMTTHIHTFAQVDASREACTGYAAYQCNSGEDDIRYFLQTNADPPGHTFGPDGVCTVCGFYDPTKVQAAAEDPVIKPGASAEPETQEETKAQTEPETQAQTQPQTQPETQAQTQPQTQPETQAQTQPEIQPETKAQTQPQTQPETQAQTQPEIQPETKAQTQPEAKITGPKKSAVKKVKALGSRRVKVTWKKIKAVTGYEIQYSTSKSFSGRKTKTVRAKSTRTSLTLKKLKRSKKYYIRIRTYRTVNGERLYSAWSAVKQVKVK